MPRRGQCFKLRHQLFLGERTIGATNRAEYALLSSCAIAQCHRDLGGAIFGGLRKCIPLADSYLVAKRLNVRVLQEFPGEDVGGKGTCGEHRGDGVGQRKLAAENSKRVLRSQLACQWVRLHVDVDDVADGNILQARLGQLISGFHARMQILATRVQLVVSVFDCVSVAEPLGQSGSVFGIPVGRSENVV
ncbi:unannotated protein [freshwater metagenome]|uniref:Unannotated protein n=1 Tax=freshwater metagenome TaxID=449393 RepID=A0A6J6DE99_9ZZZZ